MKTLPKFTISKENQTTVIAFMARLDAKGASGLLQGITRKISAGNTTNLILDLEKVDYIDTAGAAFICYLETLGKARDLKTSPSLTLNKRIQPL